MLEPTNSELMPAAMALKEVGSLSVFRTPTYYAEMYEKNKLINGVIGHR